MPNLIIYNAGTDILIGDPLGHLRISAKVRFCRFFHVSLLNRMLNVLFKGIIQRDEIVFSFAQQHHIPILMLLR